MNRRITLVSLCSVLLIAAVGFGAWSVLQALHSIGSSTNLSIESLRWTMIGSIGSWIGSIFGAIALVVSLFALWLPQRVKIKISVSSGIVLSQKSEIPQIDAYIITVKNISIKPITITNVYLHFGNKKQRDIFIGVLNQDSPLEALTPTFPKRLESGESFDYYLLQNKLDNALAHYEEKTSADTSLSIRVDEVTKGTRYYKTKWTLRQFVEPKSKP